MVPVQHGGSQRVSAIAVAARGVCPLVAVKKSKNAQIRKDAGRKSRQGSRLDCRVWYLIQELLDDGHLTATWAQLLHQLSILHLEPVGNQLELVRERRSSSLQNDAMRVLTGGLVFVVVLAGLISHRDARSLPVETNHTTFR